MSDESTKPQTPRQRDTLAELADAIERVWLTRWGSVPVVARVVIERMRRGTP